MKGMEAYLERSHLKWHTFWWDQAIYIKHLMHISTKTSKPGPVAFSEIDLQSFEFFGTFQLSFTYQSATKAVLSGHT